MGENQQTRSLVLAAAVLGMAAPAFAQGAAELVCADYAALDNAGKMTIVAELESMDAEMASSQELTNAEIEQTLAARCSEEPELMIVDVFKAE